MDVEGLGCRCRNDQALSGSIDHAILQALPYGIFQLDGLGSIVQVNPAGERMFGLPQDELKGRAFLDPRWRVVREDGTTFPEAEYPSQLTLQTGQAAGSVVMGFSGLEQGATLWLSVTAIPITRDPASQTEGVVVACVDITERKRLEAKLRQAQELASLGKLAGGIAHEINNVLCGIQGYASLHLDEQETKTPTHFAFQTITKSCERVGILTRSLMGFARQDLVEQKDVDMNLLVRGGAWLLERTQPARVRLLLDLTENLRPIKGDFLCLTQALRHLYSNALDAMPERGTLTLRTRNLTDGWVEVSVEDTGKGMSKEVLERALEPFFSTKSAIRGSGLGLSIVHSTVAAHKGQLELASEEGLGTRVVLRLPVCEPMNGLGVATPPALRSVVTSSHRVLLVDDDELVRNSIEAMLEGMGHSVSMAICGEEALSQLEDGFDPELVILDMNMPGLGGAKTLPRLRELRPRVPVLIATGRADQSVMDLMAAHAKVGLMCKPFGLEELRKHLENVGLG